jgi:hypothetical protein
MKKIIFLSAAKEKVQKTEVRKKGSIGRIFMAFNVGKMNGRVKSS